MYAYGKSIKKKFGRFHIKSKSVPFDASRLNKHLCDMFPAILRSGSPSEHDYCGSNDDASSSDYSDTSFESDNSYSSHSTKADDRKEPESSSNDASESDTSDKSSGFLEENITPKKRSRLTILDSSSESEDDVTPVKRNKVSPNQHSTSTCSRVTTSTCTSVSMSKEFSLLLNRSDAHTVSTKTESKPTTSEVKKFDENIELMLNVRECVANSGKTISDCQSMDQSLLNELESVQLKHDDLVCQLTTMTTERDQAKLDAVNEMAKVRSEYVTKIAQLTESHAQEMDEVRTRIVNWELVGNTLGRFLALCIQRMTAINSENDHIKAENENLKREHSTQIDDLRKQILNSVKENRNMETQFQQNHDQTVKRLKAEIVILKETQEWLQLQKSDSHLESKHKQELEKLRETHEKQLELEKERAAIEMELLKVQNLEKINELELKATAAIVEKSMVEEQLKTKLAQLNNIKSVMSSLCKDLW